LFLSKNGFRVPEFYLISDEIISSAGDHLEILRESVTRWRSENGVDNDSLWSVRSSAEVEDGSRQSFAGIFHTVLNVRAHEIENAIKNVIASFNSEPVRGYYEKGLFKKGIIIQKMLSPDLSGVAFTKDPHLGASTKKICVVPGLGDQLVSGLQNSMDVLIGANGKRRINGVEKVYTGHVWEHNSLKEISRTKEQLVEASDSFLNQLNKDLNRLSKLKQTEIDVEFAVENDTVYFLQVRPITTFNERTFIWDNSNIGENYPGLTLPLTSSIIENIYSESYRSMLKFTGLTEKDLGNDAVLLNEMVKNINGGMYYNVSAWQILLQHLPFGKYTSRSLAKKWGAAETAFIPTSEKLSFVKSISVVINLCRRLFRKERLVRDFQRTFTEEMVAADASINDATGVEQLGKIYQSVKNRLTTNWGVPVLAGFYLFVFEKLLKKLLSSKKISDQHPQLMTRILMNDLGTLSIQLVKHYNEITAEIYHDNGLLDKFRTLEEKDLISFVRGTALSTKIENYIQKFGARSSGGDLKIETVNFREDPSLLYASLKNDVRSEEVVRMAKTAFDYKKIYRESYPYRPFYRSFLNWLTGQVIKGVRNREDFRFYRTDAFDRIRRIFRKIDRKLLKEKLLDSPNDSWYLLVDEILVPSGKNNLKTLVASRKKKYHQYSQSQRANRYLQKKGNFIPQADAPASGSGSEFKGVPCSEGTAKGKVVVFEGQNEVAADMILIAKFFEPGQFNIFSKAKGIITEKGSLLSHTSILCRELGIPCIVNVKGITGAVETGDEIYMNAGTGEVRLMGSSSNNQKLRITHRP
jgi:phosphoenolpyruvate synthase/pyruvate phosphate dikinase